MNYFHYNIEEYEIQGASKEIQEIPSGFIPYKANLEGLSIYYMLNNGKLTEVVGEAIHEEAAHRRVNEFLSGFNVSLV